MVVSAVPRRERLTTRGRVSKSGCERHIRVEQHLQTSTDHTATLMKPTKTTLQPIRDRLYHFEEPVDFQDLVHLSRGSDDGQKQKGKLPRGHALD